MAQTSSSYPVAAHNLGPVVGPQFCRPRFIDLAISDRDFVVTVNGIVTFKVQRERLSLRGKRLLIDTSGDPVLTLREKIMTVHDKWEVFRGDSTESNDLLFSVKKSSLNEFNTPLHVFTKEDVCDFKVIGSWSKRSCTVVAGESSTILAKMYKGHLGESLVTVYPNVDYAFIISLIVILERVDGDRGRGDGGRGNGSGGGNDGGGDDGDGGDGGDSGGDGGNDGGGGCGGGCEGGGYLCL